MDQLHILVVDDVPEFVEEMRGILTGAGYRVTGRLSPLQVLKDVKKKPYDLLITTLIMRELGGFELIRGVRQSGSQVPIMMITGYGGEQAAIEATRLGASDYMNKPVSPDELITRVRRIIEPETAALNHAPVSQIDDLITSDPAMESMLELVKTVASSPSRVLITGETGTGKQLIARAIHNRSPRKNAPFIDVNCAAIPETLLESELFGHERGAFTSADQRRIGRFEEAGKGTIFLDEIGEISYAVQAKLLKVLQDGHFNRVGGQQMLQCQARVIAATNRDLEKEAAEGRFRLDLFYRLQVVTIPLPPLRKRQGDVPLLADYFLKRFSAVPDQRFGPEALQALTHYAWPGNVRELENLVEHVAVLNKAPVLPITALPERLLRQSVGYVAPVAPYRGRFQDAKQQFERDYVAYVLGQATGNMAEGARMAGMDRSQFFRLVRKLKINPREFLDAGLVDKTTTVSS